MQELMERGSRIITRCCASSSFSSEKPTRSLSGKLGQSGRLFIRRCGGIQIGTGRRSRHVARKAARSGRVTAKQESNPQKMRFCPGRRLSTRNSKDRGEAVPETYIGTSNAE